MLVDRRPRDDRFLEWKVRLFTLAAVVALVGIYLDEGWVVGTAIGVLSLALGLRFLPGGGVAENEDEDAGWPEGDATDS